MDYIKGYAGEIIQETRYCTYRNTHILNGTREALVELDDQHLPRTNYYHDECGTGYRWRITYREQPFDCGKCNDRHEDGKCPKWIEFKNEAEGQQKFLFYAASVLRDATDTAHTRFDVLPGAKTGHLANHLNNDRTILPNAEVLVVVAGYNQRRQTAEEMRQAMRMESEEMVKVLKPYRELQPPKDIFLLDPTIGKAPDGEEGDDRRFLRSEIRRCANNIGAEFINLEMLKWDPQEDMDEDEVHWSKRGTERILKVIRNEIQNATLQFSN